MLDENTHCCSQPRIYLPRRSLCKYYNEASVVDPTFRSQTGIGKRIVLIVLTESAGVNSESSVK